MSADAFLSYPFTAGTNSPDPTAPPPASPPPPVEPKAAANPLAVPPPPRSPDVAAAAQRSGAADPTAYAPPPPPPPAPYLRPPSPAVMAPPPPPPPPPPQPAPAPVVAASPPPPPPPPPQRTAPVTAYLQPPVPVTPAAAPPPPPPVPSPSPYPSPPTASSLAAPSTARIPELRVILARGRLSGVRDFAPDTSGDDIYRAFCPGGESYPTAAAPPPPAVSAAGAAAAATQSTGANGFAGPAADSVGCGEGQGGEAEAGPRGRLPPGWERRVVHNATFYLDHISREAHEQEPWVVWWGRAGNADVGSA